MNLKTLRENITKEEPIAQNIDEANTTSESVINCVCRKPDELALRMNTHKLTVTLNYI